MKTHMHSKKGSQHRPVPSNGVPAPASAPASAPDVAAPSHSFGAIAVTAAPQGAIQPKLAVGAAHDPYEDEADRVAGQVMRLTDAQVQRVTPEDDEDTIRAKPDIQRLTPDEDEDTIRAKPGAQRTAEGSFDAIVFGEQDLSGEFVVSDAGNIDMPLIGSVSAKGATVTDFQNRVVTQLRNGYLNDPKVSVEVLNYRPFFITGEVKNGGEYPYKANLTVQDAVGVAGGYSYRADTTYAYIRRAGEDREIKVSLSARVPINPGVAVGIGKPFLHHTIQRDFHRQAHRRDGTRDLQAFVLRKKLSPEILRLEAPVGRVGRRSPCFQRFFLYVHA